MQRIAQPLLIGNCRPENLLLRLSAQLLQQRQEGPGILIFHSFLPPAFILRQGESGSGLKPEPGWEHGTDGIVKGAEIPFPQEGRHPQHINRQHRCFIQLLLHRLQALCTALSQFQHHSFTPAVAPAEGNDDPLTGPQFHPLRNGVGIGLVNGKRSR